MDSVLFPDHQMHAIEIDGEPWWVAEDMCDVLETARVDSSLRKIDDDEKGTHLMSTLGGRQEMAIVNDPGLYSLILRSRKPKAKEFKQGITHCVIPYRQESCIRPCRWIYAVVRVYDKG